MKILFITSELPYPPSHGGAKLRSYQIMKQLSKENDIFLISLYDNEFELEYQKDIKKICKQSYLIKNISQKKPSFLNRLRYPYWFYNQREMHTLLKKIAQQEEFDIIHCDAPMVNYIKYFSHRTKKVVCPADSRTLVRLKDLEIEKKLFNRITKYYHYLLFRRFERIWYNQFNHCLVVSNEDAAFLKKIGVFVPITVIPSGIDLCYFSPSKEIEQEPNSIIFTGTMDFEPNIDAVCYFVHSILPLIKKKIPEIKLYIVGRNPVEKIQNYHDNKSIIVTGSVDDIRPYLSKAEVFVCPMRLGTGIKNKVLEAMGMGKSVVSTSGGMQGINIANKELLVHDLPAQFAEKVVDLLKNPQLRKDIGEFLRKTMLEKYDLKIIGAQYESFYKSL